VLFLNFVQQLSLPWLFAVTVTTVYLLTWATIAAVRGAVRLSAHDPGQPLPIKDALIGVANGMFALTVAFSAAGIYNDTLQARAAVQREAHALQNVLALAEGLPSDVGNLVRSEIQRYVKLAVEVDWPAMAGTPELDDPRFSTSDKLLVRLINEVAVEQARPGSRPILNTLVNQVFEIRTARLARITLSRSGISNAQWVTLSIMAICGMISIALVHNHTRAMQLLAMNFYALIVSAAFFLLLAHDRPFTGDISISPAPLQQLVMR
jgi:hypothetical protein